MKTKLISPFVLIVFAMATLVTCRKKDALPPVANAGPDQVIILPTDSVWLSGSGSSNPDGPISKWHWTKIDGPASFTINNSTAAQTSVKNLVAGIYKFELKVTNNGNLTATDEIVITVIAQPTPAPGPPPALPPVANAGADTTIKLLSCGSKGLATLDGSRSSDSVNAITDYLWSQISGPSSAILTSPISSKTNVYHLLIGQYVFQLRVSNAKGISSSDFVTVIVSAEATTSDLDLTINGRFTFQNNYEDCYYGPPCNYYDLTSIQGDFDFPPFGQFSFGSYEVADTASTSEVHETYMALYSLNSTGQGPSVSGRSSINFKRIIQKGGGAFSGTLKIENGTANNCNPNIYTTLDPLTIRGSIDTTAHTISLIIKGKTYF